MEPRTLLAYALIALSILAVVRLILYNRRKKERKRNMHRIR